MPTTTAPRSATSRRRIRLGAWAGILGPIAYVATWAVAGGVRSGYDPVGQAISELAEVGAPTRPAMTAAFVVFGLAGLPFAAAVRDTLPGDGRTVAAAVAVCGLMTVGAGIFPCTAGCPGPGTSVTDAGHAVTATIGYVALMAAPLLTARLLWHAGPPWRALARWSLLAGAVGSLGLLVWPLGAFGDAGGAGQRAFNTVADVWWAGTGIVLLATSSPARGSAARTRAT